jgi:uncharacterized C2H2 Zn-finger protein
VPTETSETTEETFTCARCGAEFEGGDSCPACGAVLGEVPCEDDASRLAHSRCVICARAVCVGDPRARPALCDEHRHISVIERWSQVYSTTREIEAKLIAQNLNAEGIDAQIYSQNDHIFAVDLGELSIVRVLVPVWEHLQAMEIIGAYMDTSGEVVFACPSCGEVFEPGQPDCTACGAALVG